jgi:hypothetical protein
MNLGIILKGEEHDKDKIRDILENMGHQVVFVKSSYNKLYITDREVTKYDESS